MNMSIKSRLKKVLSLVSFFALYLFCSSFSYAATYLPTTLTTDVKTISDAFTNTQNKGWTLVVATLASFGVIILFKKVVARAG